MLLYDHGDIGTGEQTLNKAKAIILHGMPPKEEYYDPEGHAASNRHWVPWLQHQLSMKDILTQTPEMPRPYEPEYRDWLEVFQQFTVDEDIILIGHSCGAGFLVRWLSENNVKVGKVILVAPFLDPKGELTSDFFKFQIDPNLASKAKDVVIFNSNDDWEDIQLSVQKLIKTVKGIRLRNFEGYGHFTVGCMKTIKFPEVFEEAMLPMIRL